MSVVGWSQRNGQLLIMKSWDRVQVSSIPDIMAVIEKDDFEAKPKHQRKTSFNATGEIPRRGLEQLRRKSAMVMRASRWPWPELSSSLLTAFFCRPVTVWTSSSLPGSYFVFCFTVSYSGLDYFLVEILLLIPREVLLTLYTESKITEIATSLKYYYITTLNAKIAPTFAGIKTNPRLNKLLSRQPNIQGINARN